MDIFIPTAVPVSSVTRPATITLRIPLELRLINIADTTMFPIPSEIAAASSIPPDTVSSIPLSCSINVGQRVNIGNSMTSIPIMPMLTIHTSLSFSTPQGDASPAFSSPRSPGTFIGSSVLRSLPTIAQTRVTTMNMAPYIVSVQRQLSFSQTCRYGVSSRAITADAPYVVLTSPLTSTISRLGNHCAVSTARAGCRATIATPKARRASSKTV